MTSSCSIAVAGLLGLVRLLGLVGLVRLVGAIATRATLVLLLVLLLFLLLFIFRLVLLSLSFLLHLLRVDLINLSRPDAGANSLAAVVARLAGAPAADAEDGTADAEKDNDTDGSGSTTAQRASSSGTFLTAEGPAVSLRVVRLHLVDVRGVSLGLKAGKALVPGEVESLREVCRFFDTGSLGQVFEGFLCRCLLCRSLLGRLLGLRWHRLGLAIAGGGLQVLNSVVDSG